MMIAMLNSQKYSCLSFIVFTESVLEMGEVDDGEIKLWVQQNPVWFYQEHWQAPVVALCNNLV